MPPFAGFDDTSASRRVYELLGPAGCGKSTLLATLRDRTPRVSTEMSIWGQPRIALARTAIGLLPVLIASVLERAPLRPAEFLQMVRVDCLRDRVRRVLGASRTPLVMDEGPLFALAWLEVFFGALPGSERKAWRHQSVSAWSELLGGVIQLDAADQEITRRIRRRRKAHPMKGATDEEIARFSQQFRSAFRSLLRELATVRPDLRVARRRTDATPREEVTRVLPGALAAVSADD
jgi:energy-coupling factor transporter ATP-binding protein EcfA2